MNHHLVEIWVFNDNSQHISEFGVKLYVESQTMIEILKAEKSGNAIVTLAVGANYLQNWQNFCSETWIKYCLKHDLGLYIQDESLDLHKNQKKTQWQKILLLGELSRNFPHVENFCYLDTDIVINPHSSNVFDLIMPDCVNLVSQRKNLPFELEGVLRRIAFNRNRYFDSRYPLDSALFMSAEQIYEHHGLPQHDDYACTGLIAGNVRLLATAFEEIYQKYSADVYSITNNGDEPILNSEFQDNFKVNWLPYNFQALWLYEIAAKYPFLYEKEFQIPHVIRRCAETILLTNNFLHFAGSWGESKMIEVGEFFKNSDLEDFLEYLDFPVTGIPVGVIRPGMFNEKN